MDIDSSYRAQILAEASRLVASGGIPADYAEYILKAKRNNIYFPLVEEAVSTYRLDHHPEASRLIADPSFIRGNRLFTELAPEERSLFVAAIMRRAETIPFHEIADANDFERKVLGEDPKVGDIIGNSFFPTVTLRDEAWQVLLYRMLKLMQAGRRNTSHGSPMLPPPSSPTFRNALLTRFKIRGPATGDSPTTLKTQQTAMSKTELFDAWTRMPIWNDFLLERFHTVWNDFLLELFHTVMANGQVREPRQNQLDRHQLTLEQHDAWFSDLLWMGIRQKDIGNLFAQKIMARQPDITSALRAGGWLRRFLPEIKLSGLTEARRIEVLIGELEKLHAMAPHLELQRFMNLLPRLVEPWTLAGLLATFDHKNIPSKGIELDSLSIYKAHTIMLWHAAPGVGDASPWLVGRLTDLVAKNNVKKYKSLDSFAKRKLGTTADALKAKIAELAAAGVDVKPLVEAIQAKFPRTKILTPGSTRSSGSTANGSFSSVEVEAADDGAKVSDEEAVLLDPPAGDGDTTTSGTTTTPATSVVAPGTNPLTK